MGTLGEYIFSVAAAGIICSILKRLLWGKGSVTAMGTILTGVFMALTVVSPITQVQLSDLANLDLSTVADVEQAIAEGESVARNALAESISAKMESYIVDRAAQLGADLSVRVELSRDPIPAPAKVYLRGHISPYGKQRLQTIIRDDLGIEKENQLWT